VEKIVQLFETVQSEGERQAPHQIFDQLRAQILDLTLPPQTLLSRNDLAKNFGVSTTPIREVLIKLEEIGLVEIFPQYATKVSRINLEKAKQSQFLRRALELELITTLMESCPPQFIDKANGVIRAQKNHAATQNIQAFMQADNEFHFAFYQAAGAEKLWQLMRRETGHMERIRRLTLPNIGRVKTIIQDHEAIIDHMILGNSEAARAAYRQHVAGTLGQIEMICAQFPDYFDFKRG
jgi:GntR family transcriptional regulator, rspAB operon transcriptional repressor